MTITLEFFGAAREVTGSKHLLTVNDRRVLLDCGMVQGPRRLANRLNRSLPFSPKAIDAVVLSHAHVDHSGSLPRLVKLGYPGRIHCTPATADLLGILLPDSAHIQEADARYLAKRGHAFEPAYDGADVKRTLKQVERERYDEWFDVCPGVRAKLIDAGHIIGSAQVVLEVDDGGGPLRIAFTGDLGRKNMPILRAPAPLPESDVLICESTYGDRLHPSSAEVAEEIRAFVEEQRGRGGRVLVPSFSIGRTQNVLWYLGRLIEAGTIQPLPIWVDSPLATKATAIVARHADLFDEETRAMLDSGRDPFHFEGVRFVEDVEESKSLNAERHGVIVSASGMCEGGRILHHLRETLGRAEDTVLIIGFQAQGTLGRKLLEGYERVKVFGQPYDVRCRVRAINGLSAHADWRELVEHVSPLAATCRRAFVVHGEEHAAMKFADRLAQAGFEDVEVPLYKEQFLLRT